MCSVMRCKTPPPHPHHVCSSASKPQVCIPTCQHSSRCLIIQCLNITYNMLDSLHGDNSSQNPPYDSVLTASKTSQVQKTPSCKSSSPFPTAGLHSRLHRLVPLVQTSQWPNHVSHTQRNTQPKFSSSVCLQSVFPHSASLWAVSSQSTAGEAGCWKTEGRGEQSWAAVWRSGGGCCFCLCLKKWSHAAKRAVNFTG